MADEVRTTPIDNSWNNYNYQVRKDQTIDKLYEPSKKGDEELDDQPKQQFSQDNLNPFLNKGTAIQTVALMGLTKNTVIDLQTYINENLNEDIKVDGILGKETLGKIEDLQKHLNKTLGTNIKTDGVLNQETLDTLDKAFEQELLNSNIELNFLDF